MSKFRTLMSNPNAHLFIALLCQILAVIPVTAPFAVPFQAIAGTLTATGLALPESGSLHAVDYEKLALTVADGVKQAVAALPSRA